MSVKQKTKLVYVLPDYNKNIGSHFSHIYELLESVSVEIDIFLVVERASERPQIKGLQGIYVQRFSFSLFRYIELWTVLLGLRFKGWKNFWVHYSLFAAIAALDVTSILKGRVFYWNCGMPWLYTRGRFAELIFRFVLRHTTLVTGTDGLKNMYARVYGLKKENMRVMPNWINSERFLVWRGKQKEARETLHIPLNKKIILFVHHLSRRKGAHNIAPVARALRDDSNTLFLVVGSGPYEKQLQTQINDEGLKNVRIEGDVPNKQIPQYFAASDVFFMPSEEEGFPRVLLEAMAMGVPFVASNVGGVNEVVPEEMKQYMVTNQSSVVYAQKLQQLLKTHKSQDYFISLFAQRLKQYSLMNITKRFVILVSS